MKHIGSTAGLTAIALAAFSVAHVPDARAQAALAGGPGHSTAISRGADGAMEIDNDAPQVNDPIFADVNKFAANAKETNEVTMDKNTLGLAGRQTGAVGALAKKADLVLIRNYSYAKEGDYEMSDVEEYLKKLNGDGWQHLVRSRSGKEISDIAVRYDKEGQTKETVIISAEPKELSIVHIVGPLSAKDLGQLRGGSTAEAAADPALKHR